MAHQRLDVCMPMLWPTGLLIGSIKIGRSYRIVFSPPVYHFDYSNLDNGLHVIVTSMLSLAALAPDHKMLKGTGRRHELEAEFAQGQIRRAVSDTMPSPFFSPTLAAGTSDPRFGQGKS